jgi:arylsulfatase A-like enzyme
MPKRRAPWWAALWAAALVAGCAPRRPNIVLVSIDTLRADHLGCYGYPGGTSPVLDELARRSTLFEEVLAPTPWTLPSHAAMLTGVHPWKLGIRSRDAMLPTGVSTLAELLSRSGYATTAVVDSDAGGFVGSRRGFGRGFTSFVESPLPGAEEFGYDARASLAAFERWVRLREPGRPFFAFLHTKSVHATPEGKRPAPLPYDKPRRYLARVLPEGRARFPWRRGSNRGVSFLRDLNARIAAGEFERPPLSEEERRELIALYDAGIYYVDEQIGALLRLLAREGLDADTVLIVTADHGEAFLEHRFVLHREVYEPLLRVPLILHDPRRSPRGRAEEPARLEDVTATILALAGVAPPAGLDGRSLLGPGSTAARTLFAFYNFGARSDYEAYALRAGRYKLIRHRVGDSRDFASEFYDLANDPDEQKPLPDGSEVRARLALELEGLTSQAAGPAGTLEEMRALGYVK